MLLEPLVHLPEGVEDGLAPPIAVALVGEEHEPRFEVARGSCFEFDSSTPFAPIVATSE